MRNSISLGPTPSDEECQQVPYADVAAARAECRRYIGLIRKTLGAEPEGARLVIKRNEHEFGTYFDVECEYDDNNPQALAYAFRCEAEAPTVWDSDG